MPFTPSPKQEVDSTSTAGVAPELGAHEWLAVVTIIGFLCLLTVIVISGSYDHQTLIARGEGKGHYLKPQEVEVLIDGAVAKPGSYRVKIGTTQKEVISLAEPFPEADLRKVRPASRVRNGQNIVIPTKPTISISVSGAVQSEGSLMVPKGTRLSELGNYVKYTDETDLAKMDRKRLLKADEKIIVPTKKAITSTSTKPKRP